MVSNAHKSIVDYKLLPIADLSGGEKKLEEAWKSYTDCNNACDRPDGPKPASKMAADAAEPALRRSRRRDDWPDRLQGSAW